MRRPLSLSKCAVLRSRDWEPRRVVALGLFVWVDFYSSVFFFRRMAVDPLGLRVVL